MKTRGEIRCSGRVSISCSACGTPYDIPYVKLDVLTCSQFWICSLNYCLYYFKRFHSYRFLVLFIQQKQFSSVRHDLGLRDMLRVYYKRSKDNVITCNIIQNLYLTNWKLVLAKSSIRWCKTSFVMFWFWAYNGFWITLSPYRVICSILQILSTIFVACVFTNIYIISLRRDAAWLRFQINFYFIIEKINDWHNDNRININLFLSICKHSFIMFMDLFSFIFPNEKKRNYSVWFANTHNILTMYYNGGILFIIYTN